MFILIKVRKKHLKNTARLIIINEGAIPLIGTRPPSLFFDQQNLCNAKAEKNQSFHRLYRAQC